jgi:hypothetical protein
MTRRLLAAVALTGSVLTGLAPAAHAEPPHVLCPWTVSVLYHDVTGEYLCYA